MMPEISSMTAATMKTPVLCSENHTSCGTFETKLDMAAPAPIPTSKAGRVQHINVPLLVNSDSSEAALVCFKLAISSWLLALLDRFDII
jgi:hypothetical protein